MENFRFAYPEYLYLLLIIPLWILLFYYVRYRKKRALKKFGDSHLIASLSPYISFTRPLLKAIFLNLCFAFVIIALARPQFGTKLQTLKTEGVELVIALDVSNSMLAQDIKPNRLERAKLAISKLIDRLHHDKLGLIIFAGTAYMQLPLTGDYGAAKLFLSTINTTDIPVQGTAIGKAIELSLSSFKENSKAEKAIIVITDGENHEDNASAIAKAAKDKNITVHTIGMGLPTGAPIPEGKNKNRYKKDREGNIILTKLNEKMLQDIAKNGKGKYIQANNTTIGLNKLMDEINKMTKTKMESKVYTAYSEKFHIFIIIALFFLLLDLLLLNKKNKILMKYNILKPLNFIQKNTDLA